MYKYTYKNILRQPPLGDVGTVCKSTQRWTGLYEGVCKRYCSLTPMRLRHPAIGVFELLLVSIGLEENGLRCEAIFTSCQLQQSTPGTDTPPYRQWE